MQIDPAPTFIGFFQAGIKPADLFFVQKIKNAFFDVLGCLAVSDLHDLGPGVQRIPYNQADLHFHIRRRGIEVEFKFHLQKYVNVCRGGLDPLLLPADHYAGADFTAGSNMVKVAPLPGLL